MLTLPALVADTHDNSLTERTVDPFMEIHSC